MLQIMLHTDGFVAEILADIGHFSVLQIVLPTDDFVGVISFLHHILWAAYAAKNIWEGLGQILLL